MTDLLLDENMDLQIVDGDFVISESTAQNQKILILSDKNDFKESPMRGVGALRYLEDGKPDALAREVRQEFLADGMTVNKLQIADEGSIEVDANY
ncbi:hypothetical protein [Flavobacterium psychrophilum]|uniref:hypothetical protein n=1 Tax=Flavobacterium psychrophilum TaxID=96345 RepID=UPI000B7C507D|nr:hypothetical protein [Flavobacterium psychrophilum]EKT3967121.1 hypothetical protein [Flavobacterium psychrophilum]MBF2024841.1 hypothetical protein [Flavobacterium psychrophilum]MCB5983170.1 hypothetical protein [Flavobacterium psychrophilum]MCB5995487.1 hypothetical protein [Flavobacterium psychrophilum]MCB5997754.1 hypothetical protein [Flavobacterium psychrophilum]